MAAGALQREQKAKRDEKGRFLKNHGAPGPGRPALPQEFTNKGPSALGILADLMTHEDPRIALRAAEIVTERIYGKAAQPLEHDAGGDMIEILAERIMQRRNGHDS